MAMDRERELGERVAAVEDQIVALQDSFGVDSFEQFREVTTYVFPGGLRPERKTDGAIGYDAYARAIVDPLSTPTAENPLRRTLGDFQKSGRNWQDAIDASLQDWVRDDESDPSKWALHLPRGERVMIGLGYATRMTFPMFYWVAPRSGFASRGITVANSPGTVDPDYRGEAGALIENNSTGDFVISYHMRIAQVIFMAAFIPRLDEVVRHDQLGETDRGAGGFGSTGTHK